MKPPPDGEEERPALDQARLSRALLSPAGLWREVQVVPETGSTNADLLARAREGAGEGLVLVAEDQTAGRGRMGRHWLSTPRVALTFSVLLRAGAAPAGSLGWVPLLAGVAVTSALREIAGVGAQLKWPNDVLAGGAKLAGILAESWGDVIVVGIGINVLQRRAELPLPTATSVLLEAADPPGPPERERLLIEVLGDLARWYRAWLDPAHPGDADRCGLREQYLRCCATVGRQVSVTMPGERSLTGTAVGIDPMGCLVVRTAAGPVSVSAGDVVHLR